MKTEINTVLNSIKKILIANRGGIARRINFTCQSLGIETVVIFCPQDATSPYIYESDMAYRINKDGYNAYLDQEAIINVALKSGATAIHPGYGFLSENYQFAQKVIDANLIWIGPDPQTMWLMGNKNEARRHANSIEVPTMPGIQIDVKVDPDQALSYAMQVGFPLILKDPLGGGGRATKYVDSPQHFRMALKSMISEAQKLTGTTSILMERYLINPRHVEVQIAGDGQNVVHLFERDCSMQRRYQKIVEEAPCQFVSSETLEKMYQCAIRLAKTTGYKNVGTIEFMVTPQEEFFFLEMNTRLQVEHSVTEMITGIDIVATQILIADSGKLPFTQKDISKRGHAIECRIYSEDTQNKFAPCVGSIKGLRIPHGQNIRLDHDLEVGKEISQYFDPMQAQLTSYGQTRELAMAYATQALKNFGIYGITTNINFLINLINSDEFVNGKFGTQFLTSEVINEINRMTVKSSTPVKQHEFSDYEIAEISTAIEHKMQSQKNNKLSEQKSKSWSNRWKDQQWV